MGAEPLLHAAVLNNARWCDAVCRSHGYPGEFTGRLWISARHALPFYPNAITLSPDVTAVEAIQVAPRLSFTVSHVLEAPCRFKRAGSGGRWACMRCTCTPK